MSSVYTIGFTKKDARRFFELLVSNEITIVVDVRLNNTSQLAGFSKYPDIEYFLKKCANCKYIGDKNFSPEEKTLDDYKKGKIDWEEYVEEFDETMSKRNIEEYIKEKYSEIIKTNNICFLCTEESPAKCHRRLIAEIFKKIFNVDIIHLK